MKVRPTTSSSFPGKASGNVTRFVSGLALRKDDVVRIVTGNGGGFGNPKRRDPELVRRDVANGLLTPERAREVYGVEVGRTTPDP